MFPIAGAVFLRPSQKFLKTEEELELFLEGYGSKAVYNRQAFNYYFLVIASYFYGIGDEKYRLDVDRIINRIIRM